MGSKIITLVGKGGVGKTSISAAIVRQLVREYPKARILAIDADPAVGLATALDVSVRLTVDDIRRAITASGENDPEKKKAVALLGEARFHLIESMEEKDGFSFLAVGRPESAGCYCSINAFLREVIESLADDFDYVVIDGEAGIEQLNRRVMEKVTHLVLVTDPSKKGFQVINSIKKVADELVLYEKIGLIVNRLDELAPVKDALPGDVPLLACIPDDRELALFDLKGRSIMELPEGSKLTEGAKQAMQAIGIIENGVTT